ncbi:MAG: 1-(5-phosphoribosyl)-5-[(5-phosphoribosylamino)methylideneamino] imidazole-4-carboxamide isomerase [Cytophagales bacterium]|nr:1-(5-phosphoribosyl)-5-[(5-phosphoribosylamino)methylideneamino] imidazole-4-carboxamide isomerase [Cytophagales bacterium]
MQLLPSISVSQGRTARLRQGDYSSEKVYDVSPIDVAKQFEDHGIHQVHLVDLEGTKVRQPANYDTLQLIKGYTSLEVNFAGGIHTDGDLSKAFEHGAATITAGSVSVKNKDLFAAWIMSYGREKIMLSADVRNEFIHVRGWQESTKINLIDHVGYFYNRGLKYLKSTEITKDGVLEGPAFGFYKDILHEFSGICIYASGGIRNMDDIKALQDMGLYGVIFGRAFYEGKISLKEIEEFVK